MAPKRNNEDQKIKVEVHLSVTAFKMLLLRGWVTCQSRAELCAHMLSLALATNEEQFMGDLARRARDKGISVEELAGEIYKKAGLSFASGEEEASSNALSAEDDN